MSNETGAGTWSIPRVRELRYMSGQEIWRGSLREFYRRHHFSLAAVRASDFASRLREKGWIPFGWLDGDSSFDLVIESSPLSTPNQE